MSSTLLIAAGLVIWTLGLAALVGAVIAWVLEWWDDEHPAQRQLADAHEDLATLEPGAQVAALERIWGAS